MLLIVVIEPTNTIFHCVLLTRYLVKFLARLAESSDINKMTPSNIATVMAPNLLWESGEAGLVLFLMFQYV